MKQQEQIALLSPVYVNTGTETFSEYSPGQCHLVWWEQCQTTDDKTLEKSQLLSSVGFIRLSSHKSSSDALNMKNVFWWIYCCLFLICIHYEWEYTTSRSTFSQTISRTTRKYFFSYSQKLFKCDVEMTKSIYYVKPHYNRCFQTGRHSTYFRNNLISELMKEKSW